MKNNTNSEITAEARVQALMAEVYACWKEPENKNSAKGDVLAKFSLAHNIAVVFGNFNYQVTNGGIEQWISNGYCADDIEKFITYLEKGLGLCPDKFAHIIRALTPLNSQDVYDRCGQLREVCEYCGGNGSSYCGDEDDGCDNCDGSGYVESQLEDLIDCDGFNTWYYTNWDNEEWWELICKLIDNYEQLAAGKVAVKPVCKLVGVDSNVFNLLSIVSSALKRAGLGKDAVAMRTRVTSAGSFNEALAIMLEYVDAV